MDYEIILPGRRKETRIYHINLLKAWKAQEGLLITPYHPELELGHQALALPDITSLPVHPELSPKQQAQLSPLYQAFPVVFSTQPGRTSLTHHQIATTPGQKVWDHHRPLPKKMWGAVRG